MKKPKPLRAKVVRINSADTVLVRPESSDLVGLPCVGVPRGHSAVGARRRTPKWIQDTNRLKEWLLKTFPNEFARARAATVLYRYYILGESDEEIWDYSVSFATVAHVKLFRQNLLKRHKLQPKRAKRRQV